MKLSEQYEKLMEFIYRKYEIDKVFRGYGKNAGILVEGFESSSGIRFGAYPEKLAGMEYLLKQGWIEIVGIDGKSLGGPLNLSSIVKPTPQGILHVEERRKPWLQKKWREIYESTIAGIIRAVKKP
jgi:hypothetical protein